MSPPSPSESTAELTVVDGQMETLRVGGQAAAVDTIRLTLEPA